MFLPLMAAFVMAGNRLTTESHKNNLSQRIGDRGSGIGRLFKDIRPLLCYAAPHEKLITNFLVLKAYNLGTISL
jgi:hypothetical protein